MKKLISIIVTIALSLAVLAGCADTNAPAGTTPGTGTEAPVSTQTPDAATPEVSATPDAEHTITVGASSTPHAEILEQVKDALAAQGYALNIVVYDDYVLPNEALADGTLDANYFQHVPYLNSFNAANGASLVSAAAIHYEPFGIYGNGVAALSELAAGATIIIPADDSNETRALLLLAQEGLITLPEGANAADGVTSLDIVDDKGYNVVTVQADTVAAQLNNSDAGTIAIINGNYALEAGLKIEDALALEDASGDAAQTYGNIIAVRSGDESTAKIQALIAALKTDAVRDYISATYNGAVVPLF